MLVLFIFKKFSNEIGTDSIVIRIKTVVEVTMPEYSLEIVFSFSITNDS